MDPDPLQIAGMLVHGRLRIERAVAEGAFGVIYRGTHLELDRPVAIKCLKVPEGLTTEDDRDQFVGRFRQEAQRTLELGDEGAAFVRVLDVAAFAMPSGLWVPFMVLEWLEGQPFDAFAATWRATEGRGMRAGEVVQRLDPLVASLAAAHRRGLAHRDVSPSNVLFGSAGPRLLDFGVAKAFEDEQTSAQATRPPLHLFFFTPSHGAPEQFDRSLGQTGPWTDVFALALLVVELLSGQPALRGKTPGELCISATSPSRPTPRARGAEVSDAVEAVLARALAVVPTDRHRDAGTFWAELKAAASAPVVSPAWPAPAPPAVVAPVAPAAPAAAAAPLALAGATPAAPRPPLRPARALPIAIASLVVVGGLGLVAFFAFRPEAKTEGSSPARPSAASSSSAPTLTAAVSTSASSPSATTAASPVPVACPFGVGARVTVAREPTAAEWSDLPVSRRFPSVNVGYVDTVQTIEGTFFAPSRAPHLLLPCGIAKKAEASTP